MHGLFLYIVVPKNWPQANVRLITLYQSPLFSSSSSSSIQSHWENYLALFCCCFHLFVLFFFFLNYAAANRWVRRANDVWWADFKVHSLLVRFSFFFFEPRARERIDTWRRITKFVVWPFESRPFCCSFVSCAWEKEMRQTTMGLSVGHSTRSRRRHFSSPNGKCGNIQVDSVPACSSRAMALIHSIQIPTTTGQNHNRKKITHIP